MYSKLITTPLGDMFAIADKQYLYLLIFNDQINRSQLITKFEKKYGHTIVTGSNKIIEQLQLELSEYFLGHRKRFTIPLEPIGTEFQKQAWQSLLQIPYGATSSYKHQAINIHRPKACRAIALANKNNPIAIIQPCHRIIRSTGDLCGYNGGIHRKKALLKLEKSIV